MALILAAMMASWGYVETRLYPDAPGVACTSWIWALLILVSAIFMAPVAGSLRFALAVAAVGTGSVLILAYYKAHRKNGS